MAKVEVQRLSEKVLTLHIGSLFLLVLVSASCRVFPMEQTPTPSIAVPISPTAQATATLILPPVPPGATLTALIEAYRRTRTPAVAASPTNTPMLGETPAPTATTTRSPTPVSGPSVYVVNPTPTASPSPSPTDTMPPSTPTPPATVTPTPRFQGWRGEYYSNPDLQGEPVLIRDDRIIDFDWEERAPAADVPADRFSVRWTRQIDFVPGGYQFDIEVDDGVRVFIDDELVLDKWRVTSTKFYDFQQVVDGPTDVRVEYFDASGNATIRFSWHYLGRFPDWRGAYYDNRTLSGAPVLVRNDTAVDFDWGNGSPAPEIPSDNFSARWTRSVSLSAGTYRFHAQADDGIRVSVDDNRIINEWHAATGESEYVVNMYLPRGRHEIRIEYYEAGGRAEVHVWWENLDAYPDWRGAYFDNRSLSGRPTLLRNDTEINFDWGAGGPNGIGPDNFSVRWADQRNFEENVYQFFAEHDDGVRLWIGNQLLIDAWYETGPVTDDAYMNLAGNYNIQVEYFEAFGDARIRVWWKPAPLR